MDSINQLKPYYSLSSYLQKEFGEKLYKLSLNGGMTCPNRDGTLGYGGCIFCSEEGSGEFSSSANLSIQQQIIEAKEKIQSKTGKVKRYIAYFQSFTNTYQSIEYLKNLYEQAIKHPEIAILSIATRPDCLSKEILDLLAELNKTKPIWIELGLQTIHEKTATFIRRGYPLSVFDQAVKELNKRKIKIIVHTILGLPGEDTSHILQTIDYLAVMPIHGIKLQLLCVLKGTDMGFLYQHNSSFQKNLPLLELEEYINTLILCIEHLPPHIVLHRVTGDGPKKILLAPLWCGNKKLVLNTLQKELKNRNTWQGKKFHSI